MQDVLKLYNSFYQTSANYASDDVCIYVYKDNSGLEALNGIDGLGDYGNCLNAVSSGVGSFTGSFNFDGTDTTARLIFHIATTNANAYDLTIDYVTIADLVPNIVAPIVSEFEDCPSSFTTSWDSWATVTCKIKRVGDHAIFDVKWAITDAASLSGNLSITDQRD